MLRDGLEKEVVALLGAVTLECLRLAHFVHAFAHGIENRGRQGQDNVPDAQPDDFWGWVFGGIGAHAFAYFGEEVSRLEFLVVRVDLSHGFYGPQGVEFGYLRVGKLIKIRL